MLAQPLARNYMGSTPFEDQAADREWTQWGQQVPFQRPYARGVASYTQGLTYAEHEMLRQRKTPHGRQQETLDFANIDENLRLPAPKHVLLSLSPPTNDQRGLDYSSSRKRLFNPAQQSQDAAYANQPPNMGHQRLNSSQHKPAWCFPGGYDSTVVPNMPFPANQRMYYSSLSQVPTVMPAHMQTPFGPTASAGQQYPGPYWPDGTFSPYRPAPVRDDRFFHWRHSRDLSRSSATSLTSRDQYRSSMQHEGTANTQQLNPAMVHSGQAIQSLPPHDAQVPYASFQDRMTSALDVVKPSYRSNDNYSQPVSAVYGAYGTYDERHQDRMLKPTPASDQLTYRDQTFSWAYRVYIDLLSQIQHESKIGKQYCGYGKPTTKPTIFPRPPKRTQSHFTESKRLGNNQDSMSRPLVHSKANRGTFIDETSRPSTAIRRTTDPVIPRTLQRPGNDGSNAFADTTLEDSNSLPSFSARLNSNTAFLEPLQSIHESHTIAVNALDSVEALCYEAKSSWTDGMLLAGCLAYGIGDYNRAHSWYQKVLKQDSKHVEAMSNLAATLLALGRRDDAVAHWSTAIKLRPGYFEAVEHLVGLFVSSNRTREAVGIIEFVESFLKLSPSPGGIGFEPRLEDDSDDQSRASSATMSSLDGPCYEFDAERRHSKSSTTSDQIQSFGAFGYAIPAADNGRLLALIHAKGNMLYSLGNNQLAASAFEDAILLATGERRYGIKGLIQRILQSCISTVDPFAAASLAESKEPILLSPDRAQQISQRIFSPSGDLPGLERVPSSMAHRAAISTTSNSLLSLAKIYQDGLCSPSHGKAVSSPGTREILALYYLSLSLQPSPSTANNVGILLASVQTTTIQVLPQQLQNQVFNYTGVVPGSGVALALAYYNYGLNLDGKHAHLYTNLGSLLKDLGQLPAAIKMYETAVSCDGSFDIALANLANAVKDQGRIADAIKYYKRAVQANPDFAEAVCGLATALNSVCDWFSRGGVFADGGTRDPIHVDEHGMMHQARKGTGWMNKVVEIVDRQLREGENWGIGTLKPDVLDGLCRQLTIIRSDLPRDKQMQAYRHIQMHLQAWSGRKWEGSRIVRLLERAVKRIGWQWYQDRYKHKKEYPQRRYARPALPISLPVPSAPTVLPFHTFTTPLSAKQVRQISQRNALRISVSTMRSAWLPRTVYPPPAPPNPCLNVGYVSSDFNNHPLAHLMQSVFGYHDTRYVRAHCYATTGPDGSMHRRQIEREAPVFRDASSWSVEKLVNQIVDDGIHVLVNLNGYTRGAKNEVFAARPAPIHMSFMGFAGTLGAEWCDYVYADEISVPQQTLAPFRYNVDIADKLNPQAQAEDADDWIYAENVIFSRSSFFCVDHKQSAPDASMRPPPDYDQPLCDQAWEDEQQRRWDLRKELFPSLADNAIIFGNFNQLYKIDPATFRMYLRILDAVPNAILWLLRFPDVGEQNLLSFAKQWAGPDTASRIIFTDVAPKGAHITRASVVDLFLDTPECNAHTTAADVIWSGTPIVTWARWDYKMCSRMASSIVASAFPESAEGDEARRDLLVGSEREYEDQAIYLARNLQYFCDGENKGMGQGRGRLLELRRMLWEGRWTSRLFDTKRWVSDLEQAYWTAWNAWENGEGGDIWL